MNKEYFKWANTYVSDDGQKTLIVIRRLNDEVKVVIDDEIQIHKVFPCIMDFKEYLFDNDKRRYSSSGWIESDKDNKWVQHALMTYEIEVKHTRISGLREWTGLGF